MSQTTRTSHRTAAGASVPSNGGIVTTHPHRRPRRRRRSVRPAAERVLHLVDVDNLLGDPRQATPASTREALATYRSAAGFGRGDLAVLATNHTLAVEVGTAWPGARLLVRSGPRRR